MEGAGLYSFRDMAHRTGLAISTVAALVYGRRQSDERTVQAFADAVRKPVTTIREWAAASLGEVGPFELPADANRLTKREREAVLAVVRAMLDPVGPTNAEGGELVDLARPPQPDLDRVAARRGKSEGRRLREEQDKPSDGT